MNDIYKDQMIFKNLAYDPLNEIMKWQEFFSKLKVDNWAVQKPKSVLIYLHKVPSVWKELVWHLYE
jgi:hypothetical protein